MPVPLPDRERGIAMRRRVVRTARGLGLGEAALERLRRVHDAAMEVRDERAVDDHDPAYLHPGRSALILLLDVQERDPRRLGAAMVVDTHRPGWVPAPEAVGDPGVNALAALVPPAGIDELAERLVVSDEGVRLVALAERLDQLRHAHLWTDPSDRRRAWEEAVGVYAPVAARTHPRLARRYDWWCRMFGSRHLD